MTSTVKSSALAVAMDEQREARTQQLAAERAQRALATMSDEQFEAGLQRAAKVRQRMERLIATHLRKDVDYGNPKNAFNKPILYIGGAEELRRVYSLRLVDPRSPEVVADDEWCSVTAHVAVQDQFGNILSQASGNCNTFEGRFFKRNGSGPTWKASPRECLHDCLSMARKRAGVRATMEATGATSFFQIEEALEQAAATGGESMEVWTDEEKVRVMKAAARRGMDRETFAKWLPQQLNGRTVAGQDEVPMLLDLLARWSKPEPVEAEVVERPMQGLDEFPSALEQEDDDLPF